MIDYKKVFRNQARRRSIINSLRFIPTPQYLKMVYWIKTGEKLDLDNPKKFSHKLNWLKLHEIHPEYTQLVDKYGVREYVENILGPGHLFPLLGVWDSFDDINFDELPDQFVLKCTHDSGSVKIIKDKSSADIDELRKFYNAWLKINCYNIGREYPYRDVKPRIIAEKYMTPEGQDDIKDYKFFCFNGKPEILFVATDRSVDVKFDFYDMDFNHLDIENIHPMSGKVIEKPDNFDEMVEIASKLSQGIKFVRIDLYSIEGKIYFGEFTFFHAGGFWPMHPDEWEYKLGDLIEIDLDAE